MECSCTHPQTSAAACREVSPEPLVLPGKKKNEKQSGNQLPLHCGSPHRRFYAMGTAEDLWGSTAGNVTERRSGEGLTTNSTWFLAEQFLLAVPKWQFQPMAILTCRTKSVVRSEQETGWGTDLPDLGPWMRSLVSPRDTCIHAQARS